MLQSAEVILQIAIHAGSNFKTRYNEEESYASNAACQYMSWNKPDNIAESESPHQEEYDPCKYRADSIRGYNSCNDCLRIFFTNFGHNCEGHFMKEGNYFNLKSNQRRHMLSSEGTNHFGANASSEATPTARVYQLGYNTTYVEHRYTSWSQRRKNWLTEREENHTIGQGIQNIE
jgi:hypothetical protein